MKTIGIILREFKANYKAMKLYGIRVEIIKLLRKYDVNVIAIPVIFNHEEKEYVHTVKIDKNTKLYEILQKDEIPVNSRHNDYVEKTSLICSAKSEEGIIEAVEDKDKKFFIGVQWHPESLQKDENSKKIFNYFIEKINNFFIKNQ